MRFLLYIGLLCTICIALCPLSITLSSQPYEVELDSAQQALLDSLESLYTLEEVVVTAEESMKKSSSSVINKEAMEHLQPSSFTDVVSMMPGSSTNEPNLTTSNTIHIREAGNPSGDDYATSSLGTSFVVDGAPISTDANLQYIQGESSTGSDANRSTVNAGVDMRTISTDDIEKVEIIRGVAPAEYGEVTSGVVSIERTIKPTPLKLRFKADGFSKLFYIGKGLGWNENKTVLNVGIDYLNAKKDPTNTLENYQRITDSFRFQNRWTLDTYNIRWQSNIDYTGSIDNDKKDPDINFNKEDSYKSQYHKLAWSNTLNLTSRQDKWWAFSTLLNFNYSLDKISRTQLVSLTTGKQTVITTMSEGYSVASFLPATYSAKHIVEGKPLNIYLLPKVSFYLSTWHITHTIAAGVEWRYDKNVGRGQIYDMSRPLNYTSTLRPRAYYDIPATNQLSWYIQDALNIPLNKTSFDIDIGIRGTSLLGIGSQYDIHGKCYVDPRFNISYNFPAGKKLKLFLSFSCGLHTKMPTLLQLYPNLNYFDLRNPYSHTENNQEQVAIYTHIIDPVNTSLKPARNFKWEVRSGFEISKHKFSLTYFRENMKNGFRPTKFCESVNYTIDSLITILTTYDCVTNGSQIKKEGIEWQYQSPRIKAIATRFTVNGAWLKTRYQNSQVEFSTNNVTGFSKDSLSISDVYVGLYDWNNGSIQEKFNTNIIADVHIERIGFTVSATFELNWYVRNQTLVKNGTPIAYMDRYGNMLQYTIESANDVDLMRLIVKFNEGAFRRKTTPFAGYLNLRVQKSVTKYANIALFVNHLLDILPDYKVDGKTIHRVSSPYFGMEVNIQI